MDYSRQALSVDAGARAALGAKLKEVGVALETAYGAPQDIEGGWWTARCTWCRAGRSRCDDGGGDDDDYICACISW